MKLFLWTMTLYLVKIQIFSKTRYNILLKVRIWLQHNIQISLPFKYEWNFWCAYQYYAVKMCKSVCNNGIADTLKWIEKGIRSEKPGPVKWPGK